MRSGRRGSVVSFALGVIALLPACTGEGVVRPSTSESTRSPTFARYFFSASDIGGVLEVSASPASICYSTQSAPARPISIVRSSSEMGARVAEVSYAPRVNDFCDRSVRPALAAALIADPSAYRISWRPTEGDPVVSSSFAPLELPAA